jgi:1-acyl-sn-glycerol-3-phosphate acyltransferase
MIAFIVSMCVALPLTLTPQYVAYKLRLINKTRKERLALSTGQFCARWLLRIIPFCTLTTISELEKNNKKKSSSSKDSDKKKKKKKKELPEPAVWVCNHTSMLDVFLLMAADRKLRGRNKRPLKIVYWKQLESNPVTKLLFQQAGFIPVQMAPGVPGTANDYDIRSFKRLLSDAKQAFSDGFDIGILPEGQLNPTPERGLLPVFSGAFTLARLSKRPVHFMALHGAHHLWHPLAGMQVTGRTVQVRSYAGYIGNDSDTDSSDTESDGASATAPAPARTFSSANEFSQTFAQVVGHFGRTGHDLPAAELDEWLTGKAWEKSVLAAAAK